MPLYAKCLLSAPSAAHISDLHSGMKHCCLNDRANHRRVVCGKGCGNAFVRSGLEEGGFEESSGEGRDGDITQNPRRNLWSIVGRRVGKAMAEPAGWLLGLTLASTDAQ